MSLVVVLTGLLLWAMASAVVVLDAVAKTQGVRSWLAISGWARYGLMGAVVFACAASFWQLALSPPA